MIRYCYVKLFCCNRSIFECQTNCRYFFVGIKITQCCHFDLFLCSGHKRPISLLTRYCFSSFLGTIFIDGLSVSWTREKCLHLRHTPGLSITHFHCKLVTAKVVQKTLLGVLQELRLDPGNFHHAKNLRINARK